MQLNMTEARGGTKPSTLRVPDHNAEVGASVVGKTSFRGSSWSSAKRRRSKEEESKRIICADMRK